jgi:hypothetical protein
MPLAQMLEIWRSLQEIKALGVSCSSYYVNWVSAYLLDYLHN